jgi:hypothetical protein
MASKQSISFFIHLLKFRNASNVQTVSQENNQTKEKLVIKGIYENERYGRVLITRHPMEANGEWIDEMCEVPEYDCYNKKSQLTFIDRLTAYRSVW